MQCMVTLASIKSSEGFESIHLDIPRVPCKGEILIIEHTGKFHGVFSVKQVCFWTGQSTLLWLTRLPWQLKPYDELKADRKAAFEKRWGIKDIDLNKLADDLGLGKESVKP